MLYEITVPQYTKMLHNLIQILDKGQHYAETKKFDFSVLLNSRLAPDQFNLTRQIQITCDTAKLCVARLTGKEAPVNDDKETTLAELKARIESTMGYLNSVNASDFNGSKDKKITTPRWEGKWLTGREYVLEHATPNFYFHLNTAYSILRSNGVDIGKKDYLGAVPYKH